MDSSKDVPLFKKDIEATVDVLKFLRPGQCLPLLFAELKPPMVLTKPMLQLGPAILKVLILASRRSHWLQSLVPSSGRGGTAAATLPPPKVAADVPAMTARRVSSGRRTTPPPVF